MLYVLYYTYYILRYGYRHIGKLDIFFTHILYIIYVYVICVILYVLYIEIWLSKKTRSKTLAKKLGSF